MGRGWVREWRVFVHPRDKGPRLPAPVGLVHLGEQEEHPRPVEVPTDRQTHLLEGCRAPGVIRGTPPLHPPVTQTPPRTRVDPWCL